MSFVRLAVRVISRFARHLLAPRSPGHNVDRGSGIDVRVLGFPLVRRPHPFVVVLVAVEEEIDSVFVEKFFEAVRSGMGG